VVLNKDLCFLLAIILAGYEPCVAHIKVYFTSLPSPDIFHKLLARYLAPASLSLMNSPDTTIWEPTLVNNYLNWREACFLSTWLEDGFKGKELLHNNVKILYL